MFIDGRLPNNDPSDLDVLGSVFVGGSGSANLLALWNAAKGDIEGDLIIGKDGVGAMILWGNPALSNSTQLDVLDPQAGLCAIGREYDGFVNLDADGFLLSRNMQLGQAGTNGTGSLTVIGGYVSVLEVLQVGAVGGGAGQIDMVYDTTDALVTATGMYIAPNRVISGTGKLEVSSLGLHNEGTLSPGIKVLSPLATSVAPPSISGAQDIQATMAITGTLTISPTGRLEIPLIGGSPGEYGSLVVTGTATLDGVLALNFSRGFTPKQGTPSLSSPPRKASLAHLTAWRSAAWRRASSTSSLSWTGR